MRAAQVGDIDNGPGTKSAMPWEFWIVRASLALAIGGLCYVLAPFALHGARAASAGFLIALVILLAELRLRHAALNGLIG